MIARTFVGVGKRFSALQRAEIAEIVRAALRTLDRADGFSALQRAEIAEIRELHERDRQRPQVSVLFNEPKLLKSIQRN